MKPLRSSRQRGAGFTLVEVMFAVGLISLILGVTVQATVTTSALAQRTSATTTLQSQTRLALDAMIRDIHAGYQVMPSFSSYSSSTDSTLVLQAPAYTSAGNALSGQYDYIVYHLVGSSAPYTLNQYVVTVSGSARSAKSDTVLAKNIQSLTLLYLVDQPLTTGDGTTTRFGLNAAVAGSGAGFIETVLNNGSPLTIVARTPAAGEAEYLAPSTSPAYPQGSILFGTAPVSSGGMDLIYSVDPSDSASASKITQVSVDVRAGDTDGSLGKSAMESVEMVSRTNLHNH